MSRQSKGFRGPWQILAVLVLAWSGVVSPAAAQEPPPGPAPGGLPPALPKVPEKGPRPAKEVAAFVEDLSTNDSYFDVTVGQGRILTTKVDLTAVGKPPALVAVGDPSVVEFAIVSSRQIRVIGQRTGVTDLSITTGDGKTYTFEVRVLANLSLLRAQLLQSFPDASVRLSHLRDHVVVEGQARDATQVALILNTIKAFLESVEVGQERKITGQKQPGRPETPAPKAPPPDEAGKQPAQVPAGPEPGSKQVSGTIVPPQIINLLRVPGARQVLLKVRVAELNRTALRQIGTSFLYKGDSALIGNNLGSSNGSASVTTNSGVGVTGLATLLAGSPTTLIGVFENAHFALFTNALRKNDLLKILAEPNLVALDGHRATFMAGGEFPVPVPQSGSGGGAATITIEFKPFGVMLGFLPHILDGGMIRLAVDPEVSSIDFAIGTSINGTVVPGLNIRRSHTVVEMKEGQTLAMAGLLQVTLEGNSSRIPGVGDLPILGPFFSNTTSKRQERELIVLVTPYLVEAMRCEQVPPSPGDEVNGPNDLEFYLGNRIEGRSGRDWRSTIQRYTTLPTQLPTFLKLHDEYLRGPHGFSD